MNTLKKAKAIAQIRSSEDQMKDSGSDIKQIDS
jgi:hypothetical protein